MSTKELENLFPDENILKIYSDFLIFRNENGQNLALVEIVNSRTNSAPPDFLTTEVTTYFPYKYLVIAKRSAGGNSKETDYFVQQMYPKRRVVGMFNKEKFVMFFGSIGQTLEAHNKLRKKYFI